MSKDVDIIFGEYIPSMIDVMLNKPPNKIRSTVSSVMPIKIYNGRYPTCGRCHTNNNCETDNCPRYIDELEQENWARNTFADKMGNTDLFD